MNGKEAVEDAKVMEEKCTEKMVYMWGYLPGASSEKAPILSPMPVHLSDPSLVGDSWKDVCGGGCGFATAISEKGKLVMWGSADDENQSYLTSGKHGEIPGTFQLPTEASVVKAAAGWAHCASVNEMNASNSGQDKEKDDDTKPLWQYVTKIKSVGGTGGGNFEIQCKLCDVIFNGSYTRVRAHLLKIKNKGVRACSKVTIAKYSELQKIDNEATLKVDMAKSKSVSLPPSSTNHQNLVDPRGNKNLVDPRGNKNV